MNQRGPETSQIVKAQMVKLKSRNLTPSPVMSDRTVAREDLSEGGVAFRCPEEEPDFLSHSSAKSLCRPWSYALGYRRSVGPQLLPICRSLSGVQRWQRAGQNFVPSSLGRFDDFKSVPLLIHVCMCGCCGNQKKLRCGGLHKQGCRKGR